jgi:hypothetical protein
MSAIRPSPTSNNLGIQLFQPRIRLTNLPRRFEKVRGREMFFKSNCWHVYIAIDAKPFRWKYPEGVAGW